MSDIVERLRSSEPLPICPYDRKSPEYWTAPNDAPCKFCGGLPEGPDKCTGADTRLFAEAATAIEARDAEIARLTRERDEARGMVIEANNSLYGSQGYFHSLNGGAYNKYHLASGIEEVKSIANKRWVRLLSAEAALAPLARLETPAKPKGNAGFYSIRHKDILAARAALKVSP